MHSRLRLLAVVSFAAIVALSVAKPPFLKVLFNTYGIKDNSRIGKARCLNCHLPPGPPRRNAFGLAVQEALQANHVRMVTPEILKSLEKKTMGDGMTFGAKIKKDLPPGIAVPKKTKPTGKGKSSGKKHALLPPSAGSNAFAVLMVCVAPVGLCLGRVARGKSS